MRSLRADNLKLTQDLTRLTEKTAEAQRKLDIAESSESALKTQLKSADAAVRGLKDDLARTKALVAQARAACATDVRRRDRQIETLKKQLGEAGRARGSRTNSAITTINVTGDFGVEKGISTRGSSIGTEDYSLRSETNAFLAKLAQDLSEENEGILNAMQKAMEQLRHMSGWNNDVNNDAQVVKQPNWQDMASELESVLDHMKTILTNPSFVPIEEVMIREEEINRLKDGWVKMETRWKEAVHLIDGWRKRMAASGKPVCDEELQMGLRLSPVQVRTVDETRQARRFDLSAVAEEDDDEAESAQQSPCPSSDHSIDLVPEQAPDEQDLQESKQYDGGLDARDDEEGYYEEEEADIEVLQESTAPPRLDLSRDSSPLPEPPQLSPLRNSVSAGNRGTLIGEKPRKRAGDFTTIVEENTADLVRVSPRRPSPRRAGRPLSATPNARRSRERSSPARTSLEEALLSPQHGDKEQTENGPPEEYDSDEDELASAPPHKTPRRGSSKLPVSRHADAQQSPLTMATIAAKLAASEREADAARLRAKLRAFRGAKRPTIAQPESTPADPPTVATQQDIQVEDVDPVKRDPVEEPQQQGKPEKRKRDRRTSKVTSRRRSTLSPWELDSLMSGNV
ncbi:hypothetical protein ACO1O0_002186 [Amphichorda felina]